MARRRRGAWGGATGKHSSGAPPLRAANCRRSRAPARAGARGACTCTAVEGRAGVRLAFLSSATTIRVRLRLLRLWWVGWEGSFAPRAGAWRNPAGACVMLSNSALLHGLSLGVLDM